eukprot:CAMPEP_0181343210 /NCGR_PEP_ID=MMETSP1101-20121128/31456_1 /TAXON_ID=46948 /ORGANISM="Rhodomonas abbreviata, Strain Caron Lab Isolate" /LENGTH=81 /DNA_ID=CAMNT_0023454807 /DNA_START=331 /DNA_END=572 /DNA_ORIENTATION=+
MPRFIPRMVPWYLMGSQMDLQQPVAAAPQMKHGCVRQRHEEAEEPEPPVFRNEVPVEMRHLPCARRFALQQTHNPRCPIPP